MLDLVGNLEDRFSRVMAQLLIDLEGIMMRLTPVPFNNFTFSFKTLIQISSSVKYRIKFLM